MSLPCALLRSLAAKIDMGHLDQNHRGVADGLLSVSLPGRVVHTYIKTTRNIYIRTERCLQAYDVSPLFFPKEHKNENQNMLTGMRCLSSPLFFAALEDVWIKIPLQTLYELLSLSSWKGYRYAGQNASEEDL